MFPFVFTDDVSAANNELTKNGLWQYKTFDVGSSTENYNEYIYFYDYVRKALYSDKHMDSKQTSYYFEYTHQSGEYILEVHDKKYLLDIAGISMRTFDTGVGILAIELDNLRYEDAESILIINDFARRIYPQFLGREKGLDDVKNSLLPQGITLVLDDEIKEGFTYYADMNNISKDATNLPSFIHRLLGSGFSSHKESRKIHIEPIIDDRMFVISMYMNDALSEKMKTYEKDAYAYEEDPFWYKYVFVDGGDKMCQSKHMTKRLIKETTYDRWVELGTLFGISRYSFVALTGSWYGKNRLEPHMRTMYFQIFTLLLAYRASILHFSKRVSDLRLGDLSLQELQAKTADIYKDYINFENNLFFRELTAQEQGIEIYQQALEVMQIEKHIKDLDNEIAELHTYVSMLNEENRNNRLETISKLGAIFLPPSLFAGIYGMNVFNFNKTPETLSIAFLAMIISAMVGYMSLSGKPKEREISVSSKLKPVIGWGLLLVLIMVMSLYFIGEEKKTPSVHTKEPVATKIEKSKYH